MTKAWPSIADLLTSDAAAPLVLLGAPMEAKSVNPGAYDRAPQVVRDTLKRFSTYDVETGLQLPHPIRDAGDVPVQGLTPEAGFDPVRKAVAACTAAHDLTLLLGGHNGVTRPAAHGLGVPLGEVGLVTLDAHFDLRDTDGGLLNGNPVRALLEDGLPGRNIAQIGLAPFANTRAMHAIARDAGIAVTAIAEVKARGIIAILDDAFARLSHCAAIMVDFDIDVVDRSQCPGASGARPGGMSADDFFRAARHLAAQPKVKLVDLTEFDPARDVADITALTAGRWVCEVAAGFTSR